MAITSAWTSEIPTSEIPVGATVPVVAELEGAYNTEVHTFDLTPASDYDNATETTAFTAVGDAAKTALDTYIQGAPINVDPLDDVVARYVLTFVQRRWPDFEMGDYQMQYTASVDCFRVTARIEWQSSPAA